MRHISIALMAALAFVFFAGPVFATEITGNTTTLPYYHQDYLRGEEQSYLALYEFFDFAAYDVGTPGLTFYFSGWGRMDALDKVDPEDEAIGDAELQSALIRYRHYDGLYDLALGRQFITTGPMSERMDSLYFRVLPVKHFGIEGFGGLTVISDTGERDQDYGFGGRIFGGWYPYFELGVSVASLLDKGDPDRAIAGGDLTIQPAKWLDVLGHAYYDGLYSSLYDVDATFLFYPVEDLKIMAQYEELMPSALLGMNSWFSVFSFDKIQKVNVDLDYVIVDRIVVSVESNLYMYSEGDPGNRFGGSLGVLWGKLRDNTFNLGAYDLDREDDTGYTELRGYLYQNIAKGLFTTIDANTYLLDDKIYDVDTGFDGSLSLGWLSKKDLEVLVTGSYRTSPYYEQDIRGLLKIAYNFSKIF